MVSCQVTSGQLWHGLCPRAEARPAGYVRAMPTATDSAFLDTLCAARRAHPLPLPLRAAAAELIARALALLFPHFSPGHGDAPRDLAAESDGLAAVLRAVLVPSLVSADRRQGIVDEWMSDLPAIREALLIDAAAIADGDPAAAGVDEVILAYPGFYAIAVHRLAHPLYVAGVPVLPRVLAEAAHGTTGIDIHPGARIGRAFAIDHGTGVVIGESTIIGDRVRIYQGVTLGALAVRKSLANTKRHPTIEDDVVIYANATILGGRTVIGAGSVIGGNVWLTTSVPRESVVQFQSEVRHRDDDALEFHI
jgi:serine O-acetyltransferase